MTRKVLVVADEQDSTESPAQNLTATDIVSIIKACEGTRVTTLKFNGLELEMERSSMKENVPGELSPLAIQPVDPRQLAMLHKQRERQVREEQLSTMMLEDPASYEQAIIDKDLIPTNVEENN